MNFHLKKIQNERWVWILKTRNNEILVSSNECYATRQACLEAIILLQESVEAEVIEEIKES